MARAPLSLPCQTNSKPYEGVREMSEDALLDLWENVFEQEERTRAIAFDRVIDAAFDADEPNEKFSRMMRGNRGVL